MQDMSTMGFLRGPGIPLSDSLGRPMGPARLGQLQIAGTRAQSSLRQKPAPVLSGAQADLAQARVDRDRARAVADQVLATFDDLGRLIGEDGAATAAEQAADALDNAQRRYDEARRQAAAVD